MIAALAPVWQVLWWLAIAGFFLVVVPVVVIVANRVVGAARHIRESARDTLDHGIKVAGNLDPMPELARTGDLMTRVGEGIERYAAALERAGAGGGRSP